MSSITHTKVKDAHLFDRPIQWWIACLLLLSFAVLACVAAELAIFGFGQDETRVLSPQKRSLAASSSSLLEFAQNAFSKNGGQ